MTELICPRCKHLIVEHGKECAGCLHWIREWEENGDKKHEYCQCELSVLDFLKEARYWAVRCYRQALELEKISDEVIMANFAMSETSYDDARTIAHLISENTTLTASNKALRDENKAYSDELRASDTRQEILRRRLVVLEALLEEKVIVKPDWDILDTIEPYVSTDIVTSRFDTSDTGGNGT